MKFYQGKCKCKFLKHEENIVTDVNLLKFQPTLHFTVRNEQGEIFLPLYLEDTKLGTCVWYSLVIVDRQCTDPFCYKQPEQTEVWETLFFRSASVWEQQICLVVGVAGISHLAKRISPDCYKMMDLKTILKLEKSRKYW